MIRNVIDRLEEVSPAQLRVDIAQRREILDRNPYPIEERVLGIVRSTVSPFSTCQNSVTAYEGSIYWIAPLIRVWGSDTTKVVARARISR